MKAKVNYPEVTADMVKKNRIKQFKDSTVCKHSYWNPEINDTVAGEVVCDRYLLIKDENGHIVRFSKDMDKSPFFDDDGACIAQAGDGVPLLTGRKYTLRNLSSADSSNKCNGVK